MVDTLLGKRLILVAGKGGVGRSTVAAAIALACARRGRRTLLFETNANDRLGGFFDRAPVGTNVVNLRGSLYAVNTNPSAALEEYGMMVLRFRRVYRLVFENRVSKYFLRAIPGLEDYSIIGKCWYHTTEVRRGRPLWDTVVFDMPASGHALSMLEIPWAILNTVPEGPLTTDARKIAAFLLDRRLTALVLVTLAEDMPVNEAREFTGLLNRKLGIKVAHLFINQIYPNRFPDGSPAALILAELLRHASASGCDANLAALAAHADLTRQRRRLNERYIEQLKRTIPSPSSELPFLFVPVLTGHEIEMLSRLVETQVT